MTLFTKIINQEIPSYKIYEDELVYAFLDIHPIQPGHTLVVPKIETDYVLDLPEPYYSHMFKVSKTISKALQKATDCARVGTMIEGFDVPHVHYHLVPLYQAGDFSSNRLELSPQQMQKMQTRILEHI
jgi:histidine triad (HIT) family protein